MKITKYIKQYKTIPHQCNIFFFYKVTEFGRWTFKCPSPK